MGKKWKKMWLLKKVNKQKSESAPDPESIEDAVVPEWFLKKLDAVLDVTPEEPEPEPVIEEPEPALEEAPEPEPTIEEAPKPKPKKPRRAMKKAPKKPKKAAK